LKDGSKTISERATRFLPVDMKDRLKSAFNRNSVNAPERAVSDDAPDYAVIFGNTRAPATQASPRLNLAAGAGVDAMRTAPRQVVPDIEEAEIVAESQPEAAPTEASAGNNLNYTALLKSDKFRLAKGKAPRMIEHNISQDSARETPKDISKVAVTAPKSIS
jgi:hypothetical protein